jgi:hypothetical protein
VVGENGIPLKERLYVAVPAFTTVPAGIWAERERMAFSPGTTGLGRSEPEINVKRDFPEEQSRTVFCAEADKTERARRSGSIYLR